MIWINGRFEEDPYQISVFDKMNIGLSVFTTLHAEKDGEIYIAHLPEHYARLCRHADILDLKMIYSELDTRQSIIDLIRNRNGQFFAVRIQITGGEGSRGLKYPEKCTVIITISDKDERKMVSPVKVMIDAHTILYSGDMMNKIKSNYAVRALSRRRAEQNGYDDVIFMNEIGNITAASVGNIVIRHGDNYYTPALDDGVLDGVTREILIKEGKIAEKSISKSEFMQCNAAWVVNSLGIRPIICIDTIEKPPEHLEE
jgi:branched-chain amino acid aminotransferase